MASYVGLVKVVLTLVVAFFAVLFNVISHGKLLGECLNYMENMIGLIDFEFKYCMIIF